MQKRDEIFLGIETGGTKTIAIAATSALRQIARIELGPANLRLVSDKDFLALLKELKARIPSPTAIGIGLPGLRTKQDESRVTGLLAKVWPGVPARATHDLELALQAAEIDEPASKHLSKIIVLSGTGSCCFGKSADGRTAKLGGWGHLLGDKASGYDIAIRGCRAAVFYFDRDGDWSALGEAILRELSLNEPNDLIQWIQNADKKQVASLAPAVFAAWAKKDRHATEVIESSAHSLAFDAVKCAARLENSDTTVQFILSGSVLLKQPRFSEMVAQSIREKWPQAVVTPLKREGAWGGVNLAKNIVGTDVGRLTLNERQAENVPAVGLEKSPTERRNPRSLHLDKLSARKSIELFLDEEKVTMRGLRKVVPQIEVALNLITTALKKGNCLFYVGAGTSGRLGILDASECPPTFRTDPELVQGIIAGGQPAIFKAVEGAEDDSSAGARAILFRGVQRGDVVVGIAASGRTPFVWGSLKQAKLLGAKVILVCFNPNLELPKMPKLNVLIAADLGPELLTGSTRLKSGTATKLILNIFTTLAMVRLGKVAGNLMIDLNPSNVKLRDRAVRIVQELTGLPREAAQAHLEKSGWVVKNALKTAKKHK